MQRNFSRIIPNVPKNYKKACHVNSGAMWSPKKCFSCQLGQFIFKSKHVGRHFSPNFQVVSEGSQRFCPDFVARIFTKRCCPDIHQIKTFGGATPASYTSVHGEGSCSQCLFMRQNGDTIYLIQKVISGLFGKINCLFTKPWNTE